MQDDLQINDLIYKPFQQFKLKRLLFFMLQNKIARQI